MSRSSRAAIAAIALFHSPQAFAQSAAGSIELPVINVDAARTEGSLTVPGITEQRRQLNQTAGSVGFVDAESYKNTYATTIRDALNETPGVFVQNRYSQEVRLSIRGSGIARAFHTRGVEILQDGVPTNLADGSGDFYQIDPLALRAVEVFRGGNALPFGASTLGGAINFVTPSAYTATAPNSFRIDGGSFGTVRAHGEMSRVVGPWDFAVSGTFTHSDGWRQHEQQNLGHLNANIGYRFSDRVETRFYFGAYYTDVRLPGSLTYGQAINNPRMANAGALSGNQARNTYVQRLANVTTIRLDVGQIDITSWAVHKHLNHPIFQVLDQDGWTYGISPRFTGSFDLGGFRNDLVVGARIFAGNNAVQQFLNVGGTRGAMTVNGRQVSSNYETWFENRFFVLPQFALTFGAKAFSSERRYEATTNLNTAMPLRYNDSVTYGGVNPRVGLLWEPVRDVQVFTNVTRSADVPDFTDLTQQTSTPGAFVPLKAQNAWTFEIGTRGRYDRFSWDVTAYRSDVRNQMLQFNTGSNIPASTFNAPHTLLQGIEFGASVDLVRNLTGNDDKLTLRQIWNYSDFRFANDPVYGNNRIPGVPQHVLRTSLTYSHPAGFTVTPTLDIVPEGAFVDYRNTFKVAGYALLGLQATAKLANGASLFLDLRNLTDKRYVSDFGPVVQYNAASTATFYPGTGRSIYGGVRYQF
ncbi:TonB-dependent receptor family protein [Phreatobacter stygius]|uniref:TonB-dependent receptor n=1 Tax=Phreatobacter stygius TaxID=1940610 RepID=A0A4D7B7S2_9HYPH|nr:TonB-dependent receptor [Phreatobacter stygius]QCI66378.1 TonB-dependent receptor [Phreatobacter stygius]